MKASTLLSVTRMIGAYSPIEVVVNSRSVLTKAASSFPRNRIMLIIDARLMLALAGLINSLSDPHLVVKEETLTCSAPSPAHDNPAAR